MLFVRKKIYKQQKEKKTWREEKNIKLKVKTNLQGIHFPSGKTVVKPNVRLARNHMITRTIRKLHS